MPASKAAIRAAFGAAASQYDSVAGVQRRIAERLATQCPPATRILDAGCGTGHGARILRTANPATQVVALDAARAMCAQSGEVLAVCGDIEALPCADGSFDLYWSSLAWQWTTPALAAREAARVLAPGGALRVASLGPATLHELRRAFAAVDSHPHVREFHSAEAHCAALEAAGFTEISVECRHEMVWATDLKTLLGELRTLGAHALGNARRRGMLGRAAWTRLQAAYETLRSPAGLPATYAVIHLSARKP